MNKVVPLFSTLFLSFFSFLITEMSGGSFTVASHNGMLKLVVTFVNYKSPEILQGSIVSILKPIVSRAFKHATAQITVGPLHTNPISHLSIKDDGSMGFGCPRLTSVNRQGRFIDFSLSVVGWESLFSDSADPCLADLNMTIHNSLMMLYSSDIFE